MDNIEYNTRVQQIEFEKKQKLKILYTEYIESFPNRLSIGDIAEDFFTKHRIRVEKVTIGLGYCAHNGKPQPVYYGIRIKKDGTAFVSAEHETLLHCRLTIVEGDKQELAP